MRDEIFVFASQLCVDNMVLWQNSIDTLSAFFA